MSVVALETPVAKRPGRPKADVETEAVRIRSDILMKLRFIALRRKVRVGELLSDLVGAAVDREYRAEKKRFGEDD